MENFVIANKILGALKEKGNYEAAKENVKIELFVEEMNSFEGKFNEFLLELKEQMEDMRLDILVNKGVELNTDEPFKLIDLKVEIVKTEEAENVNLIEFVIGQNDLKFSLYHYYGYYEDCLYPSVQFSSKGRVFNNPENTLGIEVIEVYEENLSETEKLCKFIFEELLEYDYINNDISMDVHLKDMLSHLIDIQMSSEFYQKNKLAEKGIVEIYGFVWDDVQIVLESGLKLSLSSTTSLKEGNE